LQRSKNPETNGSDSQILRKFFEYFGKLRILKNFPQLNQKRHSRFHDWQNRIFA